MRTEVRAHGIDLSDELRTIVHHETERLAQALRRRINTVRVDLYEEQARARRGTAHVATSMCCSKMARASSRPTKTTITATA